MTEPYFELPDAIELQREDYRLVNAALEAALGVMDQTPAVDPDRAARVTVEAALAMLARRLWPDIGRLDEEA